MPSHNLICGDTKGNIALQVCGLTPDRDGWTGRLPVPGTGKYEWKGSGATCRASTTRRAATSRPRTTTATRRATRGGRCSTAPRRMSMSPASRESARCSDCRARSLHDRGHGAHAAGRLLAACRARPAALQGMDEQERRRRESARHDRRLGQGPHEGYDAAARSTSAGPTTDAGAKAAEATGPERGRRSSSKACERRSIG